MFSNPPPRAPFDNRTNGTDQSRYKPDKDSKNSSKTPRWGNKDHTPTLKHNQFDPSFNKNPKKPDPDTVQQKITFKDFMKALKDIECQGFFKVLEYVYEKIYTLPENLHWQVLMEMADLAKRENKIEDARKLLGISVKLQPYAHQAWLEYSKLEEECGKMNLARKFLMIGLRFSPSSDQLAIKFIKTEEKIGNLLSSRNILGSLQALPIEKNWKILLEGCLMEARCGNIQLARHILGKLMHQCSTFGAVYLEAIKFEEKWGQNIENTYTLCEKALEKNPRYGPLWFITLRILEKKKTKVSATEISTKQEELLKNSEQYLSKELLWKLYLDYAICLERNNQLNDCRKYLKDAVTVCPENLRWKAWIAGSRVELKAGRHDVALRLLCNSLEEVPCKQRFLVLLEFSQAYELLACPLKARNYMLQACEKSNQDWKIYLERINMEMRYGAFADALEIAKEAVSKYFSTGRLWASLIQLLHADKDCVGQDLQFKAFVIAIKEVPKSGEVWCEGARLRLNPFTKYYDVDKAEQYLNYAIQFTPQYGDSFIELLRVYYLKKELHRISDLKKACINADPNYGMLWFYCKSSSFESPREVWKTAKDIIRNETCKMNSVYSSPDQHKNWIECMWIGISEVNWLYHRNKTLDFSARSKLIYGTEGLIL